MQFMCYFHRKFNQTSDRAVTLDINLNVSVLKIVCSSCKFQDMIDNNANFSTFLNVLNPLVWFVVESMSTFQVSH